MHPFDAQLDRPQARQPRRVRSRVDAPLTRAFERPGAVRDDPVAIFKRLRARLVSRE
jgi:hypothetical protein